LDNFILIIDRLNRKEKIFYIVIYLFQL